MNKIYLSGKMSGLPNFGFEIFDRNADFLRDNGWNVISPADLDREAGFDGVGMKGDEFTPEAFHEAIKRDYGALLGCNAIAFLPNWTDSRGARLESDFANVLKLDRYRVDADRSYIEKEFVLGLMGVARVGKDTIAQQFVENMGFERRGFADALKSILYSLNPILPDPNWAEVGDNFGHNGTVRVQDYVDALGWEESKKIVEIRKLLQRLGTEGGRQAMGTDIWVKALFANPHAARVVIPDVRFENEAAEIRRRGGKVIQVTRPGVGPANDHASEKMDFEADYVVVNDRTPKDAFLEIVGALTLDGVKL